MLPISRHFFPVEHPEPFCCTTGLKNGSRFPFIAHFLSSGFGCLELSPILLASAAAGVLSGSAGFVSFATCCFSADFGAGLATGAAAFSATTVFTFAGAAVFAGAAILFATVFATVLVSGFAA